MKIKFETGEVIEVDDNATQADLDEIYASIRPDKKKKSDLDLTPELGALATGLGDLATGIVTMPVSALAKSTTALTAPFVGDTTAGAEQKVNTLLEPITQPFGRAFPSTQESPIYKAMQWPFEKMTEYTIQKPGEMVQEATGNKDLAAGTRIAAEMGLSFLPFAKRANTNPLVERGSPLGPSMETPKSFRKTAVPVETPVEENALIERAINQKETILKQLTEETDQRVKMAVENGITPETATEISMMQRQIEKTKQELDNLQNKREEVVTAERPTPSVEKPIPEGLDIDVSQKRNPFFQGKEDPTKINVERESISGSSLRPDMMIEEKIWSERQQKHIPGINRNGKTSISPNTVIDWWNDLSPNLKERYKSPRGLQIFVEAHEATHNLVRPLEGESIPAYERRMNGLIWEVIQPYYEQRVIPKQVLENIEHIVKEHLEQKSSDPILEGRKETKLTETIPIEAYERERPGYEPEWIDPNQPRLTGEQLAQTLSADLEKISKKLDDHYKGISPLGTTDVPGLERARVAIEYKLDKIDEVRRKGTGKTKTESVVKSPEKSEPILPDDGKATSVFRNDNERLYQQLRNEGKTHLEAKREADTYYPQNVDIFEMSDVENQGKGISKIANGEIISPFGEVPKTVEEALKLQEGVKDISHFSAFGLGNIFGRLSIGKIFEDQPVIRYVSSVINKRKVDSIKKANDLWSGKDSQVLGENTTSVNFSLKNKIGFTLKRLIDVDSPAAVMRELNNRSQIKLLRLFEEGFNRNEAYEVTLERAKATLTEQETRAFNTLSRVFTEMGEGINTVRKGWFPAVRRGNFMVKLRYNGEGVQVETFRTALEAEKYSERVRKEMPNLTVDPVIDIKEQFSNMDKDFDLTRKITSIIGTEIAPEHVEAINKLTINFLGHSDPLAAHQKTRSGISGYSGSKLFRSERQTVNDWKEAIHGAIDEYAQRHYKSGIARDLAPLLDAETPIKQSHPNVIELAQLMKDTALNRIPSKMEGLDNWVHNKADQLAVDIAKKFGKENWYPENSIFDRGTGLSTRMFYIYALTTRPAFWIAQALSSPLAIRQMLREGTFMEGMAAAGKGTMNLFYGGDAKFKEAVNWVAQNTETFHPNFINELNQLGRSDKNLKGQYVFQTLAGEKLATAADSFSRYWAFSMMYEHYMAQGLTGKELYKKAAMETDSTMILYSKSEKAPIFSRGGTVGQLVSPLMTFAQGNLGNLVADIRLAGKTGNIKPALFTVLMTSMLGGVIGAPLVAEWELFRQLLIALDEDNAERVPSIVETALKHLPPSVSQGIPSAVTGMDVGSGLRWNPLVSGVITSNESLLSLFPAIKFSTDIGKSTFTSLERVLGADISNAEYRKAQMMMTPGGYKGLTDDLMFDAKTRNMVPDTKRGFGIVPQTDKERLSTYLGTKTIQRAKEERGVFLEKKDEQNINRAKQHHIDMILDKMESGASTEDHINKLVEYGMTGPQIKNAIKEGIINRSTPALTRFQGKKVHTPTQARKFMEGEEYRK